MALVQNLDDIINLLRWRKRVVLLVAILGTLVSTYVIANQGKVYRAFASIQVAGPQVQNPASRAESGSNAAQLMQSIEHRLTNRENLTLIIERQGLAARNPAKSPEQLVGDLRNSISIKTVAGVPGTFGSSGSISAIIVSASSSDAEVSARIANDLAQSIVDMSKEVSTSRARDTFAFFADEEKRIRNEIVAGEADLAAYQNSNADSLPVLAEARREELTSLNVQLRELDQQLLEVSTEKARLESQGVQRETDRRRLDELLDTFRLLNERQDFARKRRDEVQASLADVPEVEQTIAAQERELLLLQDRYSSVSQSFADAETALLLAERQQSERFMLLDRAITPDYAVGLGGRKLVMAAAAASLLAGILAAIAVELAFPIVRTTAQVEHVLGVGVIGAIPEVRELTRRTLREGKAFYIWNAAAVIGISLVVLLISSGIR